MTHRYQKKLFWSLFILGLAIAFTVLSACSKSDPAPTTLTATTTIDGLWVGTSDMNVQYAPLGYSAIKYQVTLVDQNKVVSGTGSVWFSVNNTKSSPVWESTQSVVVQQVTRTDNTFEIFLSHGGNFNVLKCTIGKTIDGKLYTSFDKELGNITFSKQ